MDENKKRREECFSSMEHELECGNSFLSHSENGGGRGDVLIHPEAARPVPNSLVMFKHVRTNNIETVATAIAIG